MNEEISRILQMLEAGKISAEEAERLIKAVKEESPRATGPSAESGGAQQAPPRPSPCRDIADLLRTLERAARRGALRKRREYWWHSYRLAAREEAARAQRAATQSVFDRVRFVLTERAMADPVGFGPASRLVEDLGLDIMGWDVLAWGLREEFGLVIGTGELRALSTVQALVDFVSARVSPPAAAERPAAEAATPTPEAATPAPEPPAQEHDPPVPEPEPPAPAPKRPSPKSK